MQTPAKKTGRAKVGGSPFPSGGQGIEVALSPSPRERAGRARARDARACTVLLAPAALLLRKIEFRADAAAAFLTGSLPFLVAAPELVITRVFGYRR